MFASCRALRLAHPCRPGKQEAADRLSARPSPARDRLIARVIWVIASSCP